MPALTPDERRGGLLVVALLLLGTVWDAWRAASVPPAPRTTASPRAVRIATPGALPARPAAADSQPAAGLQVDLNRADVAELERLPGIGPVLAARIVEHRVTHGEFRSVDELRAVRGVGPRLLERLRARVRAGP